LAPGERIVYDCYGSPIEARKDVTLTHISNRRKSDQFNAVCKALDIEKAKSPTQTERRLSAIPDRAKSRKSLRKSISQQRNALSKMLAYDEFDDLQSALTPIKFQR
jgi:isoleucyl-tRNA synthetase